MHLDFIDGNFEEAQYEKMGGENWIIDKQFSQTIFINSMYFSSIFNLC